MNNKFKLSRTDVENDLNEDLRPMGAAFVDSLLKTRSNAKITELFGPFQQKWERLFVGTCNYLSNFDPSSYFGAKESKQSAEDAKCSTPLKTKSLSSEGYVIA